MTKLKFAKQEWVNYRNCEWRMTGYFDVYTLSEYSDISWHVSRNGTGTGRVLDGYDGVTTLEQAKEYVYKSTCSYLQDKYDGSKQFIKAMELYNV
jgi:putative IMPACT (imprinted ancient) family translation regulator